MRNLEPEPFKERLRNKAREAYDEKEAEYPVMVGFQHFTTHDASGQKRYDRDQLVAWARQRFGVELKEDEVKNEERDDIRALLVQHSRSNQHKAVDAHSDLQRQIDVVFAKSPGNYAHTNGSHTTSGIAVGKIAANGEFDGLVAQLKKYDPEMPVRDVEKLDREQLERRATLVVDDHFRPEMRRMERALVLQILDAAWKDHLLAMDHLRERAIPGLRPGRSQGGIQARRNADVRSDVGEHRRPSDRPDFPDGATGRELYRFDLEGNRRGA